MRFVHGISRGIAILAAQVFGLTDEEARLQFVFDGRPAPTFAPGLLILVVYVDNMMALCWDESGPMCFSSAIVTIVVMCKLPHRVECRDNPCWAVVGLTIDILDGRVYSKP